MEIKASAPSSFRFQGLMVHASFCCYAKNTSTVHDRSDEFDFRMFIARVVVCRRVKGCVHWRFELSECFGSIQHLNIVIVFI